MGKKGRFMTCIVILALFLLVVGVRAADYDVILSNSQDWRDVYSVMLYASLIGSEGRFLTSTIHGTKILPSIAKDAKVLIVTSKDKPYVVAYKTVFEGNGYNNVDEIIVRNANLELASKLEVTRFIVVDDAYGYNAIAVAPYAVLTNSYVIFADEANIGSVQRFLAGRKIDSLMLFGHLDRAVRESLSKYNPTVIDTGDRFDDDIEIVKRFVEIEPTRQVLMTSGEFIESSFFVGKNPVLFIGKGTVPPQIREFIQNSDFTTAVLVGNELINTATFIRRQIGISVFVKFAQSARVPSGTINPVEDLDRFWMPRYVLSLNITRIVYNRATKSLEVTYHNPSPVGIYFKSTITVNTDLGQIVLGDEEPVFLDHGDYKTITYILDNPLVGDSLKAHVYTIYGEGKKSMENLLERDYMIEFVEIEDNSIINITDVGYDKRKKGFVVELKNIGPVKAYADVELLDLWIDGVYQTVSSPSIVELAPGRVVKVFIPIELAEEDISMNQYVRVRAYYGENRNTLIKVAYGEFAFKFVSMNVGKTVVVVVVVLILVIFLILLRIKKCDNCGARNPIWSKRCRVCGEKLH